MAVVGVSVVEMNASGILVGRGPVEGGEGERLRGEGGRRVESRTGAE